VQLDPVKRMLIPPGTKHLKLKCDVLNSSFAFKFNLRRHNQERAMAIARKEGILVGSTRADPLYHQISGV